MSDTNVILEVKNLKKTFDDHEVLKDINTTVKKGEVIAIIGPSGCGKSTFLRSLNLLEVPTSGHIIYEGNDLTEKGVDVDKLRQSIGMVFQHFNLFPNMTIKKNITLAPIQLGLMSKEEADSKAMELLKRVGLSDKADSYPDMLSGGQKQRVAIARALVNEPKVLLLDEPLGALDAKLRKDMQTELKKIQKEVGITFIFVTHDQEEALSMSDTIVVLNDGVIQQIGTPMDIYNEPQNRFVAEFIGESNIIEGNMIKDCLVNFDGIDWECVDKGFKDNEDIEVVLRPEDMDVVEPEAGKVSGIIISKVFMGVHYEYLVETKNRNYKVHTTENYEIGKKVGLTIDPFDIQVMHKMEN